MRRLCSCAHMPCAGAVARWFSRTINRNDVGTMATQDQAQLHDKHVAILMTDGVEQVEYTEPRLFLEQHGARVTLISTKAKGEQVQGFNHMTPGARFEVELNVRDAQPADFDALVLPGGVANPDQLRLHPEAID